VVYLPKLVALHVPEVREVLIVTLNFFGCNLRERIGREKESCDDSVKDGKAQIFYMLQKLPV
jgi:hypothetical protein